MGGDNPEQPQWLLTLPGQLNAQSVEILDPEEGVRAERGQVWSKHISSLHPPSRVSDPAKQLSQWAAKDRPRSRIAHTLLTHMVIIYSDPVPC